MDIENDDYSGYKAHLPQGPYKYGELSEVQKVAIAVDCYWKMASAMSAVTQKGHSSYWADSGLGFDKSTHLGSGTSMLHLRT